MRRGRLAATLAAAVVVSACLPPPSPYTGSTDPAATSVLVIGDSQTFQAENGFAAKARDTMLSSLIADPDGDGVPDRRVSMAAAIGAYTSDLNVGSENTHFEYPTETPDVLVVALGTNDLHVEAGLPATSQADAERNLLDLVGNVPAACLVLVEIVETTPWGLDVTGPPWNQFLHNLDTGSRLVVVEWANAVRAYPALVQSDGVHQTVLGAAVFRSYIESGVAECETP